jgi:hypothetical protein
VLPAYQPSSRRVNHVLDKRVERSCGAALPVAVELVINAQKIVGKITH